MTHSKPEQEPSVPRLPKHMNMRDWQRKIDKWAESKGWNQGLAERSFGDWMALLHSEISEAYEDYRDGLEITEIYYTDGATSRHYTSEEVIEINKIRAKSGEEQVFFKPCGIPIEMADLMIRLLHFFEHFELDADFYVDMKMVYNAKRPYRHGGKKV